MSPKSGLNTLNSQAPCRLVWSLLLSLALFSACSSVPKLVKVPAKPISRKGKSLPSGQIPVECVALLEKARVWSYRPGEIWRATNEEETLDVARFFETYSLVPSGTEKTHKSWQELGMTGGIEEAALRVDRVNLAQFCDFSLAVQFLDGILDFPVSKEARQKISDSIWGFVQNQQKDVASLDLRLATVHIILKALDKGYLKTISDVQELKNLQDYLQKQKDPTDEEGANTKQREYSLRREFEICQMAKEKIRKIFGLP